MPVATQVWFAFATVCGILVIIGGLFVFSLRSIQHSDQVEQSRALTKLAIIEDVNENLGQIQAAVAFEVLAANTNDINSFDKEIQLLEATNTSLLSSFKPYLDHEEERRLDDNVTQARAKYWESTRSVMQLARQNKDGEAIKLIDQIQAPAYTKYHNAIEAINAHMERDATDSTAAVAALISKTSVIGNFLVVVALAVVLAARSTVARIARRLNEDNRLLQTEVAERKRTEQQLRVQAWALDAAVDAIVIADHNGAIESVNRAFTTLTGYTAQDVIGKNPRILKSGKHDEAFYRNMWLAISSGQPWRGELLNRRKDGTLYAEEMTITPLINDDDVVIRYIAIKQDITQRTLAEEQLRWKTALLEAQLNATIDGILVVDENKKMVLQNQRFIDMMKLPPAIATEESDENRLRWVTDMIKDPEKFSQRIAYLNARPNETSRDELELKDGRTLDRYSSSIFGKDAKCYGRIWIFRDITERIQAAEQLRLKTALLEAQLNSSPDGILVVDEGERKVLQNQVFIDLMKTPPDIAADADGRRQLQWVMSTVKNSQQFIEKVNHIRSQPDAISRDEIEYKDGTILERYSAPVVGTDGRRHGRIWTFRDITERKAVEKYRDRLIAILESTTDLVGVATPDGRVVYLNRAGRDLLGVPQDSDLSTSRIKDYLPDPERHPVVLEGIPTAIRTGIWSGESTLMHSSGRQFTVSQVILSHKNAEGKVEFVSTIMRDITERKREAERLRESEEKFRQLAENINDCFWMTSPDFQQVLYCSPAYERIWGRPPAKLYENPQEWFDSVVVEDRERVRRAFGRLTTGRPSASEEFQIKRSDGETRWIHNRGFPVKDAEGIVIRVAGIASDITERKKLEAKSFQSQKMETVGKLAGGIAHEFNSILTAIIGQCELLLSDIQPGTRMAKSATEISQAAGRAATLTRQLLAYGRKQMLLPEILDLNRLISGMEKVFYLLTGGDVAIQVVPAPDLKPVKADAGQLEQVIMNMVINAREAMPNGGKLALETSNVSLSEDSMGRNSELKPGEYVMLAVTDTGAGMSEQVKARIFEPFFTTKGVGEGTGLGLSTCYGIIKQTGGHISVYSEPGRGTTFKIYLPQAEQQPEQPVQRRAVLSLPRGTETILLAEDDLALREMARNLLTQLGYKVWTAANGVEALNLRQQRDVGHIDLLFTDVVMPHMSGKELADRVRAVYPQTRILFTTAYTENATVHQGVLEKGVALLQKPYTPSSLARKLREVLDQNVSS